VPDLRIVPIVMAGPDLDLCRGLGNAIADASRGRDVLVVASSDLYHGHSYGECLRTDRETLDRIEAFDPEAFARRIASQDCQACGSAPITTAMIAARRMGADRAVVVARTNSGDVTGAKGGYVVGYGAALFYRSASASSQESLRASALLTAGEKEHLLHIARTSIREAARDSPLPPLRDLPVALCVPCGAFVTLKRRGELRGCIGHVQPHRSLAETVQQMAVAAALRDPRFTPVSPEELPEIEVEISVLSPPQRIDRAGQIRVGQHGLIIHHPDGQGLLLPQVAVERGWDRETFLAQTCRKAGLPGDAWKNPETEIHTFTAEVFGER
jgi:AmmeMemoRadiSam system protein A